MKVVIGLNSIMHIKIHQKRFPFIWKTVERIFLYNNKNWCNIQYNTKKNEKKKNQKCAVNASKMALIFFKRSCIYEWQKKEKNERKGILPAFYCITSLSMLIYTKNLANLETCTRVYVFYARFIIYVQISMSDRKKKRMKENAFCLHLTLSHPYLCSSILKI